MYEFKYLCVLISFFSWWLWDAFFNIVEFIFFFHWPYTLLVRCGEDLEWNPSPVKVYVLQKYCLEFKQGD